MDSAFLSTPRFVSAHNYNKAVGFGTNFPSPCTGRLPYNNPIPKRCASTRRAVISSVFGRKVKREVVIPDPDYRIPIVLLGMSGGFVYADNIAAAVPAGLLGLLLLVQTTRVRFVFDEQALEVKVGDELEESGENVFVGGKNRWKYSTFVNWELWWPSFPILVYFKETQTKPEGQIHFFPVIFNGKQLYDALIERCGPSKTSGPKKIVNTGCTKSPLDRIAKVVEGLTLRLRALEAKQDTTTTDQWAFMAKMEELLARIPMSKAPPTGSEEADESSALAMDSAAKAPSPRCKYHMQ